MSEPATMSEAKADVAAERASPRFHDASADVTFRSADGILFKIHSKNLSCAATGFPPIEFDCKTGEVVSLTENSKTLECLFQYMYPEPYQDSAPLDFALWVDVAEAAEKYQVLPAMAIAHLHMRMHHYQYPVTVLRYAQKHGYEPLSTNAVKQALKDTKNALHVLQIATEYGNTQLMDLTAPHTLGFDSSDVVTTLGATHALVWFQYLRKYQEVRDGCSWSKIEAVREEIPATLQLRIIMALKTSLYLSTAVIKEIFAQHAPPSDSSRWSWTPMERLLRDWEAHVVDKMAKVPSFSTFYPKPEGIAAAE